MGRHGNYRVFETYCTDPRCGCETAYLYFRKLDGEESFRFGLNLKDFAPNSKFQHLEERHLAVVGEFIKNLSTLQKAALISHYKRAKEEFGEEDPTSYLNFSSFEFGRYLAYEAVFGKERKEVFDLIHEDKRYSIVDSYCIDPSCSCETVVLTVYEAEPATKGSGHTFLFQVKLDDQSWVGMKPSERAEKFFNERIRGNVELFAVLMERYHKMKELGRRVLKRYRKKKSVKLTPSGAHVPRLGEELVEKMISSGLLINRELVAKLLEKQEVVPHLIEVLEDDRYWEPEGLGGGWGPIPMHY